MCETEPELRLTLLEHLEELRFRLIRGIFGILLGFVAGYLLSPYALDVLMRPFLAISENVPALELRVSIGEDGTLRTQDLTALKGSPRIQRVLFFREGEAEPAFTLGSGAAGIIYLKPTDPLMIRIKAALLLGLLLVYPYLLYQVWGFVNPGLLPRERRYMWPFLFVGTGLFVLGAGFAYFSFQFALAFFFEFVQPGAMLFNDMAAYLSFVLWTMFAFGLVFQLPVVVLILTRLRVISADKLAERRRGIIVSLVVVAAIITPTQDPVTLLLLCVPLYLLFELSLLISRLMDRPGAVPALLDSEPQETVSP